MSTDGVIIDNRTVQSIPISFTMDGLPGGATLLPKRQLVIQGVHLEQLADNVRTVLIPRGYIRVKPYEQRVSISSGKDWVWSGKGSKCSSNAGFVLHYRWSVRGNSIGHAVCSGLLHHFEPGPVVHVVATAIVTKSGIRAALKIKGAIIGTEAISKTAIRAGFDIKKTATATQSVSFVGMTVVSASTPCSTGSSITAGTAVISGAPSGNGSYSFFGFSSGSPSCNWAYGNTGIGYAVRVIYTGSVWIVQYEHFGAVQSQKTPASITKGSSHLSGTNVMPNGATITIS